MKRTADPLVRYYGVLLTRAEGTICKLLKKTGATGTRHCVALEEFMLACPRLRLRLGTGFLGIANIWYLIEPKQQPVFFLRPKTNSWFYFYFFLQNGKEGQLDLKMGFQF